MNFRKAYFLFKQAIDAFEGRDMPDRIKNHPSIQKRKQVEKIFSQYGLSNFRKEIEIPKDIRPGPDEVVGLLNAITGPLEIAARQLNIKIRYLKDELKYLNPNHLSYELDTKTMNDRLNLLIELLEFLPNAIDSINSNDLKCISEVKFKDKIILNKGQGIFKAHRKITELLNEVASIEVDAFDKLQAYKDYVNASLDKGKYAVIFAADGPSGAWDIATMSMRGIRSCQSWDSDSDYNVCIIGSILSKHVGIIYLTNSKDYAGLGEKMNFRSIVRFLIDENNPDKKYILVDRVYRSDSAQILEIFKQALREKTSIPVIDSDEIRDVVGSGKLAVPEDDLFNEIKDEERPYIDYPAREYVVYKNKTEQDRLLDIASNPRSTEEELLNCYEQYNNQHHITRVLLDNPATTFKIISKILKHHNGEIMNYVLENENSKSLKDDELQYLILKVLKEVALYNYNAYVRRLIYSRFNDENKYDQLWINIYHIYGKDLEIAKFIKNQKVIKHIFNNALIYSDGIIMTKLKANENLKDPELRSEIEEFFKKNA